MTALNQLAQIVAGLGAAYGVWQVAFPLVSCFAIFPAALAFVLAVIVVVSALDRGEGGWP